MNSAGLAPVELRPLSLEPKVSVLIANYNYGRFLGQAIASALQQTYRNLEVIVCDDGSTDDSVQTACGFCRHDARVSLITKSNGGQASALNQAFARSSGELICFLDSDDTFWPKKVERMVEAHRAKQDAGFGVHRIRRVNARGRPRGVWPLGAALPHGWNGGQLLQNGGVLACMPPTSGLSLHRTIAERLFPLPEPQPLGSIADQVITRLAPLLTCVVCLHETLADYRLHNSNNYARQKVCADSIHQEIASCRNLWLVQRAFLDTIDSEIAAAFPPVDVNPYLVYLGYLHARLSRSTDPREAYERFMRQLASSPNARRVWFWKSSIYMPFRVFEMAVNLMMQPSILKQAVARIRGAA